MLISRLRFHRDPIAKHGIFRVGAACNVDVDRLDLDDELM